MARYSVDVTIGRLITEVDADDEDEAITAAISEWEDDAAEIFSGGTFTVRESEGD